MSTKLSNKQGFCCAVDCTCCAHLHSWRRKRDAGCGTGTFQTSMFRVKHEQIYGKMHNRLWKDINYKVFGSPHYTTPQLHFKLLMKKEKRANACRRKFGLKKEKKKPLAKLWLGVAFLFCGTLMTIMFGVLGWCLGWYSTVQYLFTSQKLGVEGVLLGGTPLLNVKHPKRCCIRPLSEQAVTGKRGWKYHK